jgi:hypothetical protein
MFLDKHRTAWHWAAHYDDGRAADASPAVS